VVDGFLLIAVLAKVRVTHRAIIILREVPSTILLFVRTLTHELGRIFSVESGIVTETSRDVIERSV
jgi:hypothetical protein